MGGPSRAKIITDLINEEKKKNWDATEPVVHVKSVKNILW